MARLNNTVAWVSLGKLCEEMWSSCSGGRHFALRRHEYCDRRMVCMHKHWPSLALGFGWLLTPPAVSGMKERSDTADRDPTRQGARPSHSHKFPLYSVYFSSSCSSFSLCLAPSTVFFYFHLSFSVRMLHVRLFIVWSFFSQMTMCRLKIKGADETKKEDFALSPPTHWPLL